MFVPGSFIAYFPAHGWQAPHNGRPTAGAEEGLTVFLVSLSSPATAQPHVSLRSWRAQLRGGCPEEWSSSRANSEVRRVIGATERGQPHLVLLVRLSYRQRRESVWDQEAYG